LFGNTELSLELWTVISGILGFDGLESRFRALRPTGVLSIWSTDPDPTFTKRLLKTGFKVEEVKARARGGKKGGGHYFVWVATRT
jgi:spermidine synthase